jgi:hypothetical protein
MLYLAGTGGAGMVANAVESKTKALLSYVIASADLYYEEANQRTIYVQTDDGTCFRIWAEIKNIGEISAANLCEIFLEYSLNCQTQGSSAASRSCMQEFAEILGQRLAVYIRQRICPPIERTDVPYCAMSCILDSMQVNYTVQETPQELRFILDRCPLYSTSLRTGLCEVEMAHYGVGIFCDSVIRSLDPSLSVSVPLATGDEHVFIVTLPPNG